MRDLLIVVICLIIIVLRARTTASQYRVGESIVITSIVRSEPVRFEYSQGIEMQGLYMFLPLYPEIHYGDSLSVSGTVADDGILKSTDIIKHTSRTSPLFRIRNQLIAVFDRSLPAPNSGLVAGMTIGSKALVPRDFWDMLKVSGTAHVVVASGMNITLVASFLISLLVIRIPRPKAILIACIGIWIYAFFAGFDAPIIRASIMASIGLLGIVTCRVRYAWRSFVGSALIMLMVNPAWISDLGFILSFTATGSLMLFERRVRRVLARLRIPHVVLEDLSTSLSAQIGVAPILYYTFGYSNIWSPLINTLVLWTVVPIPSLGGVGGIIGLIIPSLGRSILTLIYPLTWWFVEVVKFSSSYV